MAAGRFDGTHSISFAEWAQMSWLMIRDSWRYSGKLPKALGQALITTTETEQAKAKVTDKKCP